MSQVYDGSGGFCPMRLRLLAPLSTLLLLAVFLSPACAQQTSAAPDKIQMPANQVGPTGPATTLKITFNGKQEEWTPVTLAPLQHKTVQVFNAHTKTNQTYSGVLLSDLLTRLGVPATPHGKEFRFYLVAAGADGYQVVYSVAEVTPDIHDATVLVADTLDGKPLTDSGPLQLVATGEKRPARWVKNLVEIRVLPSE
jgi:hypothetical protein